VSQGYLRGSKDFRNAYARELNTRPHVKAARIELWKQYYILKGPAWNSQRIKKWRLKNPLKWKSISDQSSKNGSHKRYYEKHKDRLKPIKAKSNRERYTTEGYRSEQKRSNPTYGLKKLASQVSRGKRPVKELINECSRAFIIFNERSRKK